MKTTVIVSVIYSILLLCIVFIVKVYSQEEINVEELTLEFDSKIPEFRELDRKRSDASNGYILAERDGRIADSKNFQIAEEVARKAIGTIEERLAKISTVLRRADTEKARDLARRIFIFTEDRLKKYNELELEYEEKMELYEEQISPRANPHLACQRIANHNEGMYTDLKTRGIKEPKEGKGAFFEKNIEPSDILSAVVAILVAFIGGHYTVKAARTNARE